MANRSIIDDIFDTGKATAAGGVRALSAIPGSVVRTQEALERVINRIKPGAADENATTLRRVEGGVQSIADNITGSITPEFREAQAKSHIQGNLLKGELPSVQEGASVRGVVGNIAEGFGSILPTVAAGVATRGRSAATQLRTGAVVGGLVGAGAAGQQEEQRIRDLPAEQLATVPGYKALLDAGMAPDAARDTLAKRAGGTAAALTAPISALGGAATSRILGHAAQAEGSLAARTITSGVLSAGEEAIQEVGEGIGQIAGANLATGERRDLGEGSAENAVLGAVAGGGSASAVTLVSPSKGPISRGVAKGVESGAVEGEFVGAPDTPLSPNTPPFLPPPASETRTLQQLGLSPDLSPELIERPLVLQPGDYGKDAKRRDGEDDKAFAKRAIDTLPYPTPEQIPRDVTQMFNLRNADAMIPTPALFFGKTNSQRDITNAVKRIAAAANEKWDRRDALDVRDNGDGTFTVLDGNATLGAMKRLGVSAVPVHVVEAAEGAEGWRRSRGYLSEPASAALTQQYAQAVAAKPSFDAALTEIANTIGGQVELADIKGRNRAEQKVASDYKGDPSKLSDLVRGTIVAKSLGGAQAALDTIGQNYEIVKVKNTFDPNVPPKTGGYRDMNLTVRTPEGALAEIQINHPEMLAAKAEAHKLYEAYRTIDAQVQRNGGLMTPEQAGVLARNVAAQEAIYGAAWDRVLEAARSEANVSALTGASTPLSISDASNGLGVGSNASSAAEPSGNVTNATGTSSISNNLASAGGSVGQSIGASPSVPESVPSPSQSINRTGPVSRAAEGVTYVGADRAAAAAQGDVPGAEAAGLPGRDQLAGGPVELSAQAGAAPAPVAGLPGSIEVNGRVEQFGPHAPAIAAAEAYARARGIEYARPKTYARVDRQRAAKIADEFERMAHAPDDPEVQAAYAAMIDETMAQYQAIKDTGLKVEFIPLGAPDPYATTPRLAILDVRDNNHLWVFPTDAGFGSTDLDVSQNPLLAPTTETISGKTALANDIFRVVHDYFGHIKEGFGFRADGEENAWRSHSAMYSPLARRAMTTETRGQNSWVNFGPHGKTNRSASGADTVYAPQKTGLMPEWVSEDGAGIGVDYIGARGQFNAPKEIAYSRQYSALDPDERATTKRLLKTLEDRGYPKSWISRINHFFVHASGQDFAARFYTKGALKGSISLRQDQLMISKLPGGDEILLRLMAHEMAHAADYDHVIEGFASESSPLFEVKTVRGNTVYTGEVAAELYRAWDEGTILAYELSYPIDPSFGFSPATIRVELFAQATMLYYNQPEALQAHAPKTFALIKEITGHADSYSEPKRGREGPRPAGGIQEALRSPSVRPFDYGIVASGTSGEDRGVDAVEQDRAGAERGTERHYPVFRSALLNFAEQGKLPNKATPAEWKNVLASAQKRGEFRKMEYDWLGVDQWLDRQASLGGKSFEGDLVADGRMLSPAEKKRLALDPGKASKHITKDQLAGFIRDNQINVRDVVLGDDSDANIEAWWNDEGGANEEVPYDELSAAERMDARERYAEEVGQYQEEGATKFSSYQVPGGRNYRELLLTLPSFSNIEESVDEKGKPVWAVWSPHDGGGWIRFRDKDSAESVASQVGGDFKSSHFDQPNILAHVRFNERTDADGNRVLFLEEVQSDWHQAGRRKGYDTSLRRLDTLSEVVGEEVMGTHGGVPDAPFKATDEWAMLAFKRMVRWAAENGFDKIAWTTGEQQANRYDLSTQVEKITVDPYYDIGKSVAVKGNRTAGNRNQSYVEFVVNHDGEVISKENDHHDFAGKKLDEIVGKEMADKIMASNGSTVFSGLDLKIGGEGMRAFYDNILPSAVNKWAKKFDGKVGTSRINVAPVDSASVEDVRKKIGDDYATKRVHSIDLTPAMRSAALRGQYVASSDVRIPRAPAAFDGYTIPSDRLSSYLTDETTRRLDAYKEAAKGKGNELRRVFQDYFLPVKQVQEAITGTGKTISEDSDVYGREELYYGRTGERLRQLEDDHVKPLVKALTDSGITQEELELFAYAKFAPDRNARISLINDQFPDGGSGMTDADAKAILADFAKEGKTPQLEALAKRLYDMNELRVKALEDAGLLSAEEAEMWRSEPFYVPLKGLATSEEDTRVKTGQGFSIGGKEAHRALGRKSRATDIVANVIAQTEATIIRAEKNRVAQSLLRLAQENPNEALWSVDKSPQKPQFNTSTGEVTYKADNLHRLADNVVSVKVDGEQHYVTLHDKRLAEAMKNLGSAKMGAFLRAFSSINRFLSLTRTMLAPEFVLANFTRDLQTAAINLSGERSAELAGKTIANVPQAVRAMYAFNRNKSQGGEWHRWASEFAEAGGMTSFVGQQTVEEQQSKIKGLLADAKSGVKGAPLKLARELLEWVSDANGAVENGVRLSAYANARRSGMSQDQAARLAKNLTVNFNKKGAAGTVLNALYLFFNASVQGSARFLGAMKSPKVRKIMAATAVAGFVLSMANRANAGDDDDGENRWEKVPEWEKARNLILFLPGGNGKYIKIPMPYTYNLPFLIGEHVEGMANGKTQASSAAANVVNAMLTAFNPLGEIDVREDSAGQAAKLVAPSAIDPLVDIALNRNFFGAPISPEASPFDKVPDPDSQRYFQSTNPGAVWLANALNSATGGDKLRSGLIDVSPASMVYLFDYLTGGTGSFLERTVTSAMLAGQGEKVPLNKIPFSRTFLSELDDRRIADTYYKARDDVNLRNEEFKFAQRMGFENDEQRRHAATGHRLAARLRSTERGLRELREQRKAATGRGDKAQLKRIQARERALQLAFARLYLSATAAPDETAAA